jgi:hypothetical protein
MKRFLSIAIPSLLLLLPAQQAGGNGCPLPCSGEVATPESDRLVFVQPEGEQGTVVAYDTKTGAKRFVLPRGHSSANGAWHFTGFRAKSRTTVANFFVRTGGVSRSWSLRGRWHVAGVSPQGRWLALSKRSFHPLRTDIAIANAFRGRVVHRFRLRGNFEVETVSNDGKRLFLIQHLRRDGAPRYLVRLYDLSSRRLQSEPLRGGGDRIMAGYAWSGVASPNGRWLLTLYLNTRRSVAFIHALDLRRSSPRCIDLPSGEGAFESLKRYSLTLSPDGGTLFAANPALGVLAKIDLATRRVVRVARFTPERTADAERGATSTGTISRDGRTLYFSGGRHLWAYDAVYGQVRGPYPAYGRVLGFGYGKNDRRVFVIRADRRMVVFDAATGRRLRS